MGRAHGQSITPVMTTTCMKRAGIPVVALPVTLPASRPASRLMADESLGGHER